MTQIISALEGEKKKNEQTLIKFKINSRVEKVFILSSAAVQKKVLRSALRKESWDWLSNNLS